MPGKKKSALASGEQTFISAIRKRVSPRGIVRVGVGDDCAVLHPGAKNEVLITTDFSLEHVHFRRDWHSPESIGHRCLARGLSDLAAMGAKPSAAFLSLAIPAELTISEHGSSWAERFLNGLLRLADLHAVSLAGGDTAQSPDMVLADITLIGTVPKGRALLRSGAKAGDIIYVTGALGGAAAELLALGRNPQAFFKLTKATSGHPHLFPEPRLAVGANLLAKRAATAAIDVSDGLSTDLAHLCEESGLAAQINAAAIPIHPLAQKAEADGWIPSALHMALHGGEDYELLFTAPAGKRIPAKIAGVPIHAIGRMKQRSKRVPLMEIISKDGKRAALHAGGWEHFR